MPKVIANAMSGRDLEAPAATAFKAKIRVPRLDGGKMGVLATRTPHRPAPIGLSVAKVRAGFGLGFDHHRLLKRPIIPIHPTAILPPPPPPPDPGRRGQPAHPRRRRHRRRLPRAGHQALRPVLRLGARRRRAAVGAGEGGGWVGRVFQHPLHNPNPTTPPPRLPNNSISPQVEAADEPLKLAQVVVPPEVEAQVDSVWRGLKGASVYRSSGEVVTLIKEVLGRDIRSLNQRLYIHPVGPKAAAGQQQQQEQEGAGRRQQQQQQQQEEEAGPLAAADEAPRGRYIVVLDGMDVTYDLSDDGTVLLRGVYPLGGGVDGGEELAAAAGAAAAKRLQAFGAV
jgi:hypothetical protein